LRRVLARMKALRSAINAGIVLSENCSGPREERFESARHQAPTAVLGDLYKLRSFGHLQDRRAPPDSLSPTTSRRGTGSAEQCTARAARPRSTCIGNIFGKEQGGRREGPVPARIWKARIHAGWLDGTARLRRRQLEGRRAAIKEAGGPIPGCRRSWCSATEEGHYGLVSSESKSSHRAP
jgi:hypothetical protein